MRCAEYQSGMDADCDYLVIGGGSAGAIVASRLATLTAGHVILVEAGRSDQHDPAALYMSQLEAQDESYDWGYGAQTVQGGGGRIAYARAKMLGGCANHNDCAFLPPPASDLDNWVALGARGWGPQDMAAALQRVEDMIEIEASPPGNALSRAFIDAGISLGLPERNFRGPVGAGAGGFPLNAQGDMRQSSSVAYLHPLIGTRQNLRVMTGVLAERLLFDATRVVGAVTSAGAITARSEVVLCAGSINTPQLLMVSGIGPAAHLRAHGIGVVADLSGVGQNLVDHVSATLAYELHSAPPPWARTPCEATVLWQTDPSLLAPDLLFHFVLRLREKYVGVKQFEGVRHGVKISPNVARPKSRGMVTLSGGDLRDKPVINLNYFSDSAGYDRQMLLKGLQVARRLAGTEALAPWLKREVAPGPDCVSDDDIFAYVKATCETVYHPAGTCRMGAADDAQAVVTPDLRVKSVQGLRVADASVFPDMVTVNINNTVMMVAERAVDLILAGSAI